MSLNAIRLGILYDLDQKYPAASFSNEYELVVFEEALRRFDAITMEEEIDICESQRRLFLRAIVDLGMRTQESAEEKDAARARLVAFGKQLWKLSPE